MKKYRVNVNGTNYEITLEEVNGAQAAAPAPAPTPVAAAPAAVSAGAEQVLAPMPGNILAINAQAGDMVKAGQAVVILEAMKMENEIMAPKDGKIASINVQKGATVESGALLFVIE